MGVLTDIVKSEGLFDFITSFNYNNHGGFKSVSINIYDSMNLFGLKLSERSISGSRSSYEYFAKPGDFIPILKKIRSSGERTSFGFEGACVHDSEVDYKNSYGNYSNHSILSKGPVMGSINLLHCNVQFNGFPSEVMQLPEEGGHE